MITDSFHGIVLSIIFQKPFIVIGNQIRGLSRMSSLLTIFGLKERLISTESELKESFFENIDYENVNDIKVQWKNKSLDFLKNNL
ncbi:MAG: polysaccharide pyruvyl transferase family protein [Bacteroidales bacterium]|nr:polysaccharide pyruvyl transferase family protein [Bacteroidales bacterium]